MKDKTKFVEILTGLAEVFDAQVSDAKLALYWEALSDLTTDELIHAAGAILRTARFFPTPAEILSAARPKGSGSMSAFRQARDACSRIGSYRSVEFEDKRITRTIQLMGGWVQFCKSEQDEHWLSKEFCRAYESLSDGELEHVPALTGLHRGDAPVLVVAAKRKQLKAVTAA